MKQQLSTISKIVIHCSATREDQSYSAKQLERDHNARKILSPMGYHVYIRRSGEVIPGRSLNEVGAHVRGFNFGSLGICYEGGLDKEGNPKDTRTEQQLNAILQTLIEIINKLQTNGCDIKKIKILGHRDLSPDIDGDGEVEKHEWLKECPCFDAKEEYNWLIGWILDNEQTL